MKKYTIEYNTKHKLYTPVPISGDTAIYRFMGENKMNENTQNGRPRQGQVRRRL